MAKKLERSLHLLSLTQLSSSLYFLDPILLSVITDVITAIASSPTPGAYSTLVAQVLPTLIHTLEGAANAANESWLASSALELVESVIEGGGKGQLGDGFVAGLAPSLFNCLSKTQDREIMVVCTYLFTTISVHHRINPVIYRKGHNVLL